MNEYATNAHERFHATLYYDGACPLCTSEIRRLEKLGDEELQLVDIHKIENGNSLPGKETLLRNLHYISAEGEILTGIEANVAAWQHTRFGVLWRWLRWSWLKPLTSRMYAFWASRRYHNLYGDRNSDAKVEMRRNRHNPQK